MIFRSARSLLAASWWLVASTAPVPSVEAGELLVGFPKLEVEIEAGETHRYGLAVHAGDAVQIDVEQEGIDLMVILRDGTGDALLTVDSPNGRYGTEQLLVVAPRTETLEVEVTAPRGAGQGHYDLRSQLPGPASSAFQDAVTADQHDREAWQLVLRSAIPQAVEAYARALPIWCSLGRARRQADSAGMLCTLHLELGRIHPSRKHCDQALSYYRSHGPADLLGKTLLNSGLLQLHLGQPDRALPLLEEAQPIFDSLGNAKDAAMLWSRRGLAHLQLGELGDALYAFEESLSITRHASLEEQEAHTNTDLAGLLLQLRRPRKAMDHLRPAHDFYRREGNSEHLGTVEWRLAEAHRQLGELDIAESLIRRAIERHLASPNLRTRALDFYTLGQILDARDEPDGAHEAYRSALSLTRKLEDPRSEGLIRAHLGYQKTRMGRIAEGLQTLERACEDLARLRDTTITPLCRGRLAEALSRLGRHLEAWREIEPVLNGLEQHRASLDLRDLRLSYFDFRQDYFDLALGILAQLELEAPEGDWARRALRVHEQRLASEIRRTRDRSAPQSSPGGPVDALSALAPHTLILVFALRPEESLLWILEDGHPELHRLAAAVDLESRARELVSALSRSNRRSLDQARKLGVELFEDLLSPVGDRLDGQRLVIVADGALAHLPFGALLSSSEPSRYLLEDHEIVHLPSLASLSHLRQRSEADTQSPGSITVFADPIFSPRDPRLHGIALASAVRDNSNRPTPEPLERLPGTAREAAKIRDLVHPSRIETITGFAATRERFLETDFGAVDILHLATHGLRSPYPERTGLVFGLADPEDQRLDGFLPASEIANLDLPLDLVVLSACESVLGPIWRGEGSTGLSWSFLVAGTSRVISTLWKVSDQPTALWMESFYHALLVQGLAPAAAFREAQLTRLRQPGSIPADWAGFQFVGDWRPLPPSLQTTASPP